MNDTIPSPLKNFTPRQNPPKQTIAVESDDLSRLDSLSREELIALVRRLDGAAIGMMTKEEVAEAMLFKLAHTALTSRDTKDTLAAIREWLDRSEGKPMQRQQMLVAVADAGDVKQYPATDAWIKSIS